VRNEALFSRAQYQINDDWSAYSNATISRVKSFGRYAPVPAQVFIPPNTPNNPASTPRFLLHRFDSLGTRDNFVDSHVYDYLFGVQGRIGEVYLDIGARSSESKMLELGRNYLVRPIAEQFIARGDYNIFNPRGNPANVLNAMKATVNREATFELQELFAIANLDLFELAGGTAGLAVGTEYRSEDYADLYDSLSEAGVIGGSAGNSAGGGRHVRAFFAEALFPLLSDLEVGVAGRYDKYSDYGNDFSPKLSVRWQPIDLLTLRGSYGEGFRAPSLDILTQAESFNAAQVSDPATCRALGQPANCAVQTNAFRIANPNLESENSTQWSVGVAVDPFDWLSVTLDHWNIEIENRIAFFSANVLVARELAGRPVPSGLGVFRFPDGAIDFVREGFANEGDVEVRGTDLTLRTTFAFGDWGNLQNQFQISDTDTYRLDGGENLAGTNGAPKFRAQLLNQYSYGDFTLAWNVNHIDQHNDLLEEFKLASWTTHDLSLTWAAPWNGRITVGVNNAADKDPVLDPSRGCATDGSPRGYCTQLYDGYGRIAFLRYSQNF
jgi:iron complex outermembrane recepter protein